MAKKYFTEKMKNKVLAVDVRKQLDSMPFDRDGMHATGWSVCFAGTAIYWGSNWWNEYEDLEGNLHYRR